MVFLAVKKNCIHFGRGVTTVVLHNQMHTILHLSENVEKGSSMIISMDILQVTAHSEHLHNTKA